MNTTTELETAFALCEGLPLRPTQLIRLILELVEESGGRRLKSADSLMAHCRRIIRLGVEAAERQKKTVAFKQAVEETLRVKSHLSAVSLRDIRYYLRKLMRSVTGLERRPMRDMSTAECAAMLEKVFPSPCQRKKARAILSGVFTVARKRGWCEGNPVAAVDVPQVREREIRPLSLAECRRLLRTAERPEHRACAPALGLMLWAGVRPHEVRRLRWKDIDMEEQEVIIPARHSKTGGGRHIPLYAPLADLLKKHRREKEERICPRQWSKQWRYLRRQAGFAVWTPDVLRHTFASYHAKTHRNLPELQLCMGHRNSGLLRERYVNLRGISRNDAADFWLAA